MSATFTREIEERKPTVSNMKALVFRAPNDISLEQILIPKAGPGEAVIRGDPHDNLWNRSSHSQR